ncbi:MAG TPA: hypothetical protein VJN18_09875 [Polyangiaceae bacterium]|nr:hypothetical protein [Polyangiaceae bacterium]
MTNEVPEGLLVRGIDGTTPLGFLAALGLLQVLADSTRPDEAAPRLSWKQLDAWRPIVHGVNSLESVSQLVEEDRTQWADSPLLGFRYVKREKQGPKAVGGLRAPLAVVRAWARSLRDQEDETSLAYGSALFCQDVTEVNKKPATEEDHRSVGIAVDPDVNMDLTVERNFFDLTSRNAQFLEQVEIIRDYLTVERILHALETGEPDYDAPRTLDWDPSSDTPGAIYTGFRRGYLPVHEWLGFRALRLFPLAGSGSKVRMTACTGRRLDGEFTWPLWERAACLDVLRALLGHPDLLRLRSDERRAFGISELLSAGLTKKADGYTGTFAPARPV